MVRDVTGEQWSFLQLSADVFFEIQASVLRKPNAFKFPFDANKLFQMGESLVAFDLFPPVVQSDATRHFHDDEFRPYTILGVPFVSAPSKDAGNGKLKCVDGKIQGRDFTRRS